MEKAVKCVAKHGKDYVADQLREAIKQRASRDRVIAQAKQAKRTMEKAVKCEAKHGKDLLRG